MDLKNLQKHIRTLVTLEETDAPVISCYLNREGGASEHHRYFKERGHLLKQSLSGQKPDKTLRKRWAELRLSSSQTCSLRPKV
jgi:hypothetical protein